MEVRDAVRFVFSGETVAGRIGFGHVARAAKVVVRFLEIFVEVVRATCFGGDSFRA